MVKNIPTIERSTKIRFGKNTTDDQGENTIVLNASNTAINASSGGSLYISPVRLDTAYASKPTVVLMMYNTETKELVESGERASDLIGNQGLAAVTNQGNVTSNVVSFVNNTTALVTQSNVGIANSTPGHTLSVGSNLYVDDTGSNVLVVSGGVRVTGDLDVIGNVTAITSNNLVIEDAIIELGKNNTSGDLILDLGLIMGRPDSNVTVGFKEETNEIILAFTESSAYSNTIVPLTSEDINVHVYGRLYTEANVGVLNTNPIHTLDVGSNLFVDDVGSNILVVTGNTNITGDLTVDTDTLFVDSSANKIGVKTTNPDAEVHVVGNAYVSSNTTTDGTLTLNHPTTAILTDLNSNVEIKLNQMANVVIDTTTLANEDMLVYDGSNWVNQLQNHTFLYAKALETISKGDAVYASGNVGNNTFHIRKAQANSSSTMPALGVAYQDLAENAQGLIVTFGRADGINTDNFQEGETVYVSNVTAGGLSNVKPYAGTDFIQNIGLVVKGHPSTGIVSVTGVGRSNDIPNAPIVADEGDINYVYVNDANNDLKKILPTNLLTQLQTLEQVSAAGNTTSNIMSFTNSTTSIVTSSNAIVGGDISIAGLNVNKLPVVGTGNFLEDSLIGRSNGTIVISSDVEILGNLVVDGNSYIIESNSLVIADRIIGIANNNTSHELDIGIVMGHPGKNVALIHHGEAQGDDDPHDHTFTIGYTQNTVTDNHIFDDSNLITVEILGNLISQNNITVQTGSYYGDGTTLTGLALLSNFNSNVSRIGVLETDLTDNASRIGVLETDLTDNASRIGVLETDLTDNASRIGVLETDLTDNASRIGVLETDLTSNAARVGDLETDKANLADPVFTNDITVSGDAAVGSANLDATLHVTGNAFVSANLEVGASALYVDTVSATSNVGVGTATPGYSLDVIGDLNFSGSLYQGGSPFAGSPWNTETSPDALNYTAGNVGIGAADPEATLDVTGNAFVSSNVNVGANVFIAGGLVTNTGGVTKKTYSFTGDLDSGQTIANSTIKLTFTAHVFYAKVVAHLVESDDEVSTLSLECGGGHWTGGTPLNVAIGPISIFGSASTNPWDSTVTPTTTTIAFKPTTNMAVAGHYNVFIEYISASAAGAVTKITEGSTDVITFGY